MASISAKLIAVILEYLNKMGLAKTQAEHWASKDLNIIQSYWESPPATLRSQWFVEQLKKFQFNSIFEIGCFSGRNLRCIGEAFPEASLNGLDINKRAVGFAKARLPAANLMHMNLHDMHNIDKKYDVVFTSSVLIHVPPDELSDVVKKCLDLSSHYVMHIESSGRNEVVVGPKTLNPTYKVSDQIQWAPDLLSIYRHIGFDVEVIKLPDDCKTNGASELLVINRNS